MEYGYDDQWVPGVQILQQQRPARNRYRMGSEQARAHGYWQGETLLIPGGPGMQRASSMSGQRPQNIVINNEIDQQQDARSRSRDRSRHRSRSRRRYEESESEDSDWDEREHERRRHRRHSHAIPERSPSPQYDYKTKEKLKKLDDLEREKQREKQEEEIRQEMLVKKAKADLAEAERKKKEEEIRKRAIDDYNREQLEKDIKAKKEKEKADKEFEEKVRAKFLAAGYTEDEAERVLEGKRNKREVDVYDKSKTTFVKVHRKYLLPETLEAHHLPWEWDDLDGNYIIIKRWVDKDVQDELFEHTRKIKERKLIAYESPEKQKDKLYIVRKKSPARRSWMFT